MISIQSISNIPLSEVLRRSPACGLPDAEATLREAVNRSIEVRYGLLDGEVACMWGLIPPSLLSTTAYLWLLTTDIIAEHKFLFIRHSQRWMEDALKTYPIIIGDVLVSNAPARKWLDWLGAEFSAPFQGHLKFVIRKKTLHG